MSLAVQVTVVVPTRKIGGASFVKLGEPPQSSVAVGSPRLAGPQLFMATGGGTEVKTGGVVSTIVTSCVSVPRLPWASSALQVTSVLPSGYGEGASLLTVSGSSKQTSTASGRPIAVAAQLLSVAAA